jgi:hypothetical protein
MRSDHYLHPEFGVLSPTRRFRRELRTACFSVLLGIGIGAAAVIALSGNNNADDVGASHRPGSASVAGEQPAEPVLGLHNDQHAAGIEKKVHEVNTSKPDRSTAEANSENEKTNAATTCADSNSSCGNIPPRSTKPRAVRMPAVNDGLPIGRLPVGRPDASAGMTSGASSASSEQAAHLTAGVSDEGAAEPSSSDRPPEKTRKMTGGRDRSRQEAVEHRGASRIGRGRDRPAGEVDRAYALDRSFGPKGFWDWSR